MRYGTLDPSSGFQNIILDGDFVEIAENFQAIVFDEIDICGELELCGELVFL